MKKTILFVSILSVFLMIMMPCISAINLSVGINETKDKSVDMSTNFVNKNDIKDNIKGFFEIIAGASMVISSIFLLIFIPLPVVIVGFLRWILKTGENDYFSPSIFDYLAWAFDDIIWFIMNLAATGAILLYDGFGYLISSC